MVILITLGVLYNHAIPVIFKIERIENNLIENEEAIRSLDFKEQVEYFLKLQFSIIILFWTSLWAVKLSFLMFYRRIFAGLPGHMIWWKLIFVFTILAYLGCLVTNLKSCTPISNYFRIGKELCDVGGCHIVTVIGACDSDQNLYFQNLNLYYSTAVDILCDIFSKNLSR